MQATYDYRNLTAKISADHSRKKIYRFCKKVDILDSSVKKESPILENWHENKSLQPLINSGYPYQLWVPILSMDLLRENTDFSDYHIDSATSQDVK